METPAVLVTPKNKSHSSINLKESEETEEMQKEVGRSNEITVRCIFHTTAFKFVKLNFSS